MPTSHLTQLKTDKTLLESYVASGDGTAFTELVTRYAPMVYRACLRLLGNHHDAEDATQAAFAVLARKAGSLRQEGRLNGWLHRVAHLVALEALRRRSSRERQQEQSVIWYEGLQANLPNADLDAVLSQVDAEVDRLSEVLRDAVILRYLRGFSEQEAAAQAGCPVGTMKWRTSEGLAKLRQRLVKRGVPLSGVALAGLLAPEASGAVPVALVSSILATVKSIAARAATTGAETTKITTLTKGVINMLFYTKLKTAAMIGAAAVLVGASFPIGMAVGWAGEEKTAQPAATGAAQAAPRQQPSLATSLSLDDLKRLLEEKKKAQKLAYNVVENDPDLQTKRKEMDEAEQTFRAVLARSKGQAKNPELDGAVQTHNTTRQAFLALYEEKFAAAGGTNLATEIMVLEGHIKGADRESGAAQPVKRQDQRRGQGQQ